MGVCAVTVRAEGAYKGCVAGVMWQEAADMLLILELIKVSYFVSSC